MPREDRSALEVYSYRAIPLSCKCTLMIHLENDRCGKRCVDTNCTKVVHLNVHLGLEVYQKGTTPRSRCTLLLALGAHCHGGQILF